ncbi:MAG: NTP transferase domain-containing protein, partial [Sporomusaceae bacterium]|jgi:CTP:molybdopterin cytidylyltransferase MocA|nr:NTP transferase domain-containing protein [Sporomusaceae bacterium]
LGEKLFSKKVFPPTSPQKEMKIAGIVVAAGYSSRMGRFKPLLELGEKTVLERAVESLRQGGVEDVLVVGGHFFERLGPVLEKMRVDVVYNPIYEQGMFSSVVAGLKALLGKPAQFEAFFLLPGDIPLIRARTIRELVREGKRSGAALVQPVFNGQAGHPPLIGAKCFESILGGDSEDGLRGVLSKFAADKREVAVIDQGILLDMDLPEDYEKLVRFYAGREIPTAAECVAVLRKYQPNPKVLKHGQKVGSVGKAIAGLLNTEAGFDLNLDLIEAGGYLHDLAKGKHRHARRGATLVSALGFPLLAPLVGLHMDLKFNGVIDETAIVFLADKLAQGEKIVTISERFDKALGKFAAQPEIEALILERRQTAFTIFDQIADLVGRKRLQETLI